MLRGGRSRCRSLYRCCVDYANEHICEAFNALLKMFLQNYNYLLFKQNKTKIKIFNQIHDQIKDRIQ